MASQPWSAVPSTETIGQGLTTSSRPRFMRLSRVFFATETEIEPRGSSSDCCDASLGTVDARIGHCPGMLSTNQSARVNPRPLRMSACDDGSSMEMCKGFLDPVSLLTRWMRQARLSSTRCHSRGPPTVCSIASLYWISLSKNALLTGPSFVSMWSSTVPWFFPIT